MYQSLLNSVQKGDVLFVLYHLAESKQIDPGLVNRPGAPCSTAALQLRAPADSDTPIDTVTGLIPLQFALALPFKECRRSALILRILLLSGSQRARSTKRKAKLDNAALDEIFRAASVTQHEGEPSPLLGEVLATRLEADCVSRDAADTARLLLNELALDAAEQWLWNNELDAEEAYAAAEQDQPDVQAARHEPSDMSEKLDNAREPCGLSHGDVTPPLAPSDSASASARPSATLSTQLPMPTPHHGTSSFLTTQAVQSFVVDCLTDRTTSDDLARFLSHALGGGGGGKDRLVESVHPTFSSGVNAFRVVLAHPVDASKVEALDNAELDGVGMIPPAPQTVPSSRMPDYDDGWW